MAEDKSRYFTGIIIIALGTILLLNNLQITNVNVWQYLWQYWPVLIIIWGINSLLTGSKAPASLGVSLFILLLGIVLLTNSLEYTAFNFRQIFNFFFPLLIILVGASLFFSPAFSGKSTMAILGGVERGKNSPWNLESGSYVAFLGGIELDLRHAVIPDGETLLDLTAVLGGVEVRVPADLPVITDGFAVLGGLDFLGKGSGGVIGSAHNEQNIAENGGRVLKIQARAIMGGIEIKKCKL